MRIGILSDTHDEMARTRRALELLRGEGVEALVHCGDFASPAILRACAVMPLYFVFGNHDADAVPDLEREAAASGAVCLGWGGVTELGGKRLGVAHGHITADMRRVLAEHPDYLLFGHWHIMVDSADDRPRRINPGALHLADE